MTSRLLSALLIVVSALYCFCGVYNIAAVNAAGVLPPLAPPPSIGVEVGDGGVQIAAQLLPLQEHLPLPSNGVFSPVFPSIDVTIAEADVDQGQSVQFGLHQPGSGAPELSPEEAAIFGVDLGLSIADGVISAGGLLHEGQPLFSSSVGLNDNNEGLASASGVILPPPPPHATFMSMCPDLIVAGGLRPDNTFEMELSSAENVPIACSYAFVVWKGATTSGRVAMLKTSLPLTTPSTFVSPLSAALLEVEMPVAFHYEFGIGLNRHCFTADTVLTETLPPLDAEDPPFDQEEVNIPELPELEPLAIGPSVTCPAVPINHQLLRREDDAYLVRLATDVPLNFADISFIYQKVDSDPAQQNFRADLIQHDELNSVWVYEAVLTEGVDGEPLTDLQAPPSFYHTTSAPAPANAQESFVHCSSPLYQPTTEESLEDMPEFSLRCPLAEWEIRVVLVNAGHHNVMATIRDPSLNVEYLDISLLIDGPDYSQLNFRAEKVSDDGVYFVDVSDSSGPIALGATLPLYLTYQIGYPTADGISTVPMACSTPVMSVSVE